MILEELKKIPPKTGVYLFLNDKKGVIYVGKAVNLKNRLRSYFQKNLALGPKTQALLKEAKKISYILVDSEVEALLLEAELIKKYKPKYNVSWKDDKSHLYIKITIGEKTPLVQTARREKEQKGVRLFGPFPSARTVRQVLKTLRRIFPYCQHKKTQKSCLWVHLGLCPDPYRKDHESYRQNIKNIIIFLEGKKERLIKTLAKEMEEAAKREQFEKAAKIKKQIDSLNWITTSYRQPEEYLFRPDLFEDIKRERMTDLKEKLQLPKMPERIEAFDISNIMGKDASGSMIVFKGGEPEKSEYKRFKIRISGKPDDYQMMEEVLLRRLTHKDWPFSDLILLDGGRGQLNIGQKILKQLKIKIPICALAKREEEIYLPHKEKPLRLPPNSAALKLLQHLRDEAHRFAISYHRLLRRKTLNL